MKDTKIPSDKSVTELFQAINLLDNLSDTKKFLRDLLTTQEILEFANRWKVARLLADNVPYTKIQKETGMSTTTIARISMWLKDGAGGYKTAINKLNSRHHAHRSNNSLRRGLMTSTS